MSRPVIGLCTCLEPARWGVWDRLACVLDAGYVEAVQRAGGNAILLPPDPAAADDPGQVLDMVDGLLLAGGSDIDPSFYGQTAQPGLELPTVPERDRFEIALANAALDRGQPVLGICRGHQILNVARGGTLHQDVLQSGGDPSHRTEVGSFDANDHAVELTEGSLVASAAGSTHTVTKSHHHQAVDRLGEGFAVTGTNPVDGSCEAIELVDGGFALGVQWHPEATPGDTVIAAFVEAAAGWRAQRDS